MTNLSLKTSVAHVFNKSQESAADHLKLVKSLSKVHTQCRNKEKFLDCFVNCLKVVLIHGERENSVNCCLDFAAKFVASFEIGKDAEEDSDPFFTGMFDFLLSNHNVKSHAVRFRVCQFINRVLDELSDSAAINSDLFDRIYETMLERVQDRIASVRIQAVIALQRLQNPASDDCPVMKALVFHLDRDPHPDVRRAILRNIGCTFFSLDFVLGRLRDVKDTVRRDAFIYISERVHVRSLSIANRVMILKLGLHDQSAMVTLVVKDKLIPAWVQNMNGSFISLLRGLDVEGCSELVTEVMKVWFGTLDYKDITSVLELDAAKLLAVECIKPEIVIYWRSAVKYLRDAGVDGSGALDTILPEMTDFAKYIRDYITEKLNQLDQLGLLSMEFMVEQMLQMAPCFDLADEAGRLNLCRDLCALLQCDKTSPSLTRIMVQCVSILEPDSDLLIFKLLEVISELREPLTHAEVLVSESDQRKKKIEIAQIRVKINEMKDELERVVCDQDFESAQQIQKKIDAEVARLSEMTTKATEPQVETFREERNDPMTLLKCLSVVCGMLKNWKMLKLSKELQQLRTSLVLPCVENEDPAVRNAAFEALGIMCTCDVELARDSLFLFIQAVQMDHMVLQVTTAKVLFDLVHFFGLQNLEDKDSNVSLSAVLGSLLDSEDTDMQTLAVEGFTKLMISSRIESPAILSRLVISMFDPMTSDNPRLRQVLHVFAPLFATISLANQQQLEQAFLPALKILQNAPTTSPLSEINISDVVKIFVELTQESLLANKSGVDHNIHDSLAMKLCTETLRDPDSPGSKVYLRALLQLSPSFSNPSHNRDLLTLTAKLTRVVKEKNSAKLVDQFNRIVQKHSSDSASDEAVQVPTGVSQARPKTKKLLSKLGNTLGATVSDAESERTQEMVGMGDQAAETNRMGADYTQDTNDMDTDRSQEPDDGAASQSPDDSDTFYSPNGEPHAQEPQRTVVEESDSSACGGDDRKLSKKLKFLKDSIDSEEELIPPTPPKRVTRSRKRAN